MIKRYVKGFFVGCVLSVLIIGGFGIKNLLLVSVIGILCGASSVGVALIINQSIHSTKERK